ncbi:MAG TPA: hypothetical protein VHV78_14575, partial [Gemmatimonadaceae bacterium]|nr:hypothetical protein [Gemmatimonadaceae bacterium]
MTPTTLALLALLVTLAAAAAFLWRRALVMCLPFLAMLDGVAIPLRGSSIRLDQLVACLLVVPLAASVLIGARRFRADAATWWLAGILMMNVVASVLHSPARSYSIVQCANLASVWIIYVLLLNFLDTRAELESFLRALLWAAVIGSAGGVAAYALAMAGVNVGGAEVSAAAAEHLTMAYGAYGTLL